MRAGAAGAVGRGESGPAGDPALPVPARPLRLLDARAPLRTFPRAGRRGPRVSAGPLVEDRRGLGAAAAAPPMVGVFLEGAVPVPDHRPPRHCAVSDRAQPHVTGAGSDRLAAFRRGLRVFSPV